LIIWYYIKIYILSGEKISDDIPARKDRNSDGGGIIMYYKTHVNIKRRVDLKNSLAECMWVELKTKLQNILISIIYRSEIQSHHRFGTSLMVC
jgi:hypothetical protein